MAASRQGLEQVCGRLQELDERLAHKLLLKLQAGLLAGTSRLQAACIASASSSSAIDSSARSKTGVCLTLYLHAVRSVHVTAPLLFQGPCPC